MNIIAIQLVLVGTKSDLIVMCKKTHGSRHVFIYAHTLILLSLAVTHYRSS